MTRSEHMAWCKKRALAYLPHAPRRAVASMVVDLAKHPETTGPGYERLADAGALALLRGSEAVRLWIEGFND